MTDALPLRADARHEQVLRRARKQARRIRGFYANLTMYVVWVSAFWIVNLAMGGKIWAQWPTLGWGIGVIVHGINVFAGSTLFGSAWEDKKVEELMARENLKVVSREKQLVEARMRMLQAQIEPHFLFNTLATIQSLVPRAPDRAGLMLENFIAYLRQTLSASREHQGTVRQEFDLLRHYLELLKIRMGERLQFELRIADGLESAPLAPMLLQPLVENAIKHGLEPKVEGGRVRVEARRDGDAMLLSVADDGLGFPEHAGRSGDGVGLANLRERLAVLYDGQARLAVADADPGTAITVRVPLAAPLDAAPRPVDA